MFESTRTNDDIEIMSHITTRRHICQQLYLLPHFKSGRCEKEEGKQKQSEINTDEGGTTGGPYVT